MALVMAAGSAGGAPSLDRGGSRALPASIEGLRLDSARTVVVNRAETDALLNEKDTQRVLVRLKSPSVAELGLENPGDQIVHRERVKLEQAAFVQRIRRIAPQARVVGEVQIVLNALLMEADATALRSLATDASVVRITRVADYQADLSETVPYITAKKLQRAGKLTGKGVKVAVLDSGIDYTHVAFGGAGTLEAYEAARGASDDDSRNTARDGLFPTHRVAEGYDFVGEAWPNGPLAPDDDPIDFQGHGTHVADIIGGASGVAPKVSLYAVKVCSAVATSCSGEALIQGMEYAADPNGDGSTADRVDVINMSLGSPYGQPFDDDLAAAVDGASRLGILTVASAGNSGDKPYVTGTPAAARSALSVAQTSVPSAFLPQYDILEPAAIAGTYSAIFQPWSAPLQSKVSAMVRYGDGVGGNLNGCASFAPGSLANLIVLVDRGGCNFSLKTRNVAEAGGVIAVIGLIAPGDPFEGGFGGELPQTIPGYMISQADSNRIKSGLPNTKLSFDPNLGLPLAMSMVGSSSRGPSNFYNAIKPEIGAPGASISAVAGSGTGTEPFGGTSGAAPMVAGSAALILEGYPRLKPHEVKARLMNNAYRDIVTDPITGRFAEITRIGSGEVRVYDAWVDSAAAWDEKTLAGALSFGQHDVKWRHNETRNVVIRNYSSKPIQYSVRSAFRYADDAALRAVQITVPPTVTVPANGKALLPVTISVNGERLLSNAMNSGSQGANPATLTLNEIDGFLLLNSPQSRLHLPWHVLPRKAAQVSGPPWTIRIGPSGEDLLELTNSGVGTAQNDAYALLAESPNQPTGDRGEGMPMPDIRAVGINTYPVPAGFCSANPSFIWAFAINTWERQTHLLPVAHVVSLDTNSDGTFDYEVYNLDLAAPTGDGRQATFAQKIGEPTAEAFFFTEHATNTGNTVLLICGEQVGLTGTDMLATSVKMRVDTLDYYFGGPGDSVDGLTVTPLGERYFAEVADIPGLSRGKMKVTDFGPWPGNSEELGILLFTNGRNGGATKATEARMFKAVP
jgi:subtilisin family serine protease